MFAPQSSFIRVILFTPFQECLKHFDEIKMFIDSFSLYRIIDYDDLDTAPDTFLKKLSDHLGMPVPELFTQNSTDGFFKGLDLQNSASKSNLSIKKINIRFGEEFFQNILHTFHQKEHWTVLRKHF